LVVVGGAGTVDEALRCLRNPIDVAVVDWDLPDGTGAEVIRALHAARRGSEALLLTASADQRDLGEAIRADAAAVLHKTALLERIVAAVRGLGAGEHINDPAELVRLMREAMTQQD
jgi:DNA-binding NarL/FixJ family response regulator